MGLEVVEFQPEHAKQLMESGVRAPKLILGTDFDQWAKMKQSRGPAATGIDDGRIVAIGGIEILRDGLGEAWCVLSQDIRNWHSAPAIIREQLQVWTKQYSLFRVQAYIATDFPAAIRFAKWLGFQYEGFAQMYLPGGENAFLYVMLNERNRRKWKS